MTPIYDAVCCKLGYDPRRLDWLVGTCISGFRVVSVETRIS